MSLLQDYEEAKEIIGADKYNAIEKYLDIVCPQDKCDKYYEAVNKNVDLPIEKQIFKQKKLEKEMGIILLSDVLYKKEEWDKFDKWYNEDYLHRKVEILNIWESSHDDMRCNANLYQNNKLIANININIDECDVMNYSNTENIDYKKIFKSIIYSQFDGYSKLPKISKCSKLLQEIYDNVCCSEATMCHIDFNDWKDDYGERYSDKDFQKLKEEVKKYHL